MLVECIWASRAMERMWQRRQSKRVMRSVNKPSKALKISIDYFVGVFSFNHFMFRYQSLGSRNPQIANIHLISLLRHFDCWPWHHFTPTPYRSKCLSVSIACTSCERKPALTITHTPGRVPHFHTPLTRVCMHI